MISVMKVVLAVILAFMPVKGIPTDTPLQIHQGGYCLDYHKEADQTILYKCDKKFGNPRQIFEWKDNDAGAHQLRSDSSNKCLGVEKGKYDSDGVPLNHARIVMTQCDPQDDYQLWEFNHGTNHFSLYKYGSKCMDYNINRIQEGYILIWDCRTEDSWLSMGDDTLNQRFKVVTKFSLFPAIWSKLHEPLVPCLGGLAFSVIFVAGIFAWRRNTASSRTSAEEETLVSELEGH